MKLVVLFSLVAVTLAAWHNPDENKGVNDPSLREGDIKIKPSTRGSTRGGLWRKGVVPYMFSPEFAKWSSYVWAAKEAMKVWSQTTCVKFVKRTKERDYVYFVSKNGCYSYVGRIGGRQEISLGTRCNWEGIAVHELGHALGFHHEQSRPDRDTYVEIRKGNIETGAYNPNFMKYSTSTIDSLGTPYDYGSIMHYGPYAFSKNLKATIVAKKPGAYFGQRVGPSKIDIKQMRLRYSCADKPYTEFGSGCKWWTKKAAYRCWRYCNPSSPKKGDWCWTNKSCAGGGWMGLGRHSCPASVSFAKCASSCS